MVARKSHLDPTQNPNQIPSIFPANIKIESEPPENRSTFPVSPVVKTTPRTLSVYPFNIIRTQTGNLPVYQEIKNGGTLLRTRIRRVCGDGRALRDLLREKMSLGDEDIILNNRTQHVIVRGHKREEVIGILEGLGV